MPKYNFPIPENLHGFRLDKAVSTICNRLNLGTSRGQIQKAIKEQKLLVNGVIISNLSASVKENDEIELLIDEEVVSEILPTNIPLDILYEDDDLIVLSKSATMTTHPGAGNYNDTLVNALLHHTKELSDIGGETRPGIVHRLDKNTSGLMVVAKNNETHSALAEQIETRVLKRKYKALVWGMIRPQDGIIRHQMARSSLDRKKMTTVKSGGKTAVTHYKTLEIFKSGMFSLLECQLETGRTHQIRVHLSHVGHSVFGDQTYGNNRRKIEGCPEQLRGELAKFNHQALHSFYISFVHPKSSLLMEFEKELPEDYTNLMEFLRG
jgi:23S rRNA pseudouridine1911/1915/1917 synthase